MTGLESSFQKGMRGTMSSYDLDMSGISSMIAGDMMPRPLSVLPSLVSVTFIGHGTLSNTWMQSLFCVHWVTVYEALSWLKIHNLKYYECVQIDGTQISKFSDNDVPIEILGVIHQTDDVAVVEQEAEGYVPQFGDGEYLKEDEMTVNEGTLFFFSNNVYNVQDY